MCVELGHHNDIGKTIEQWQNAGWRLHSYEAVGSPAPMLSGSFIKHYLLFEKGE
jgi:hypothetical protein